MPVLFAVTLFLSASLLFMVQPMVGRMILPLLGGSPAAWSTCMVFFQVVLLLGYLYAHKVTANRAPRQQVWIHLGVLFFAIGVFALGVVFGPQQSPIPVVKSLAPQSTSYPMFGVLILLFVAIGVPFFAVSTSAPLLQRWFAYSGHPASKDPYFLYAASNAGSLISLLSYPLFIEPTLTLKNQAWLFAAGFVALLGMIYVCSLVVKKSPAATITGPMKTVATPPPTLARKLKWLALAFVPSSLMIGVTFHMTTDIASIPLLWVVPLALYLLTFIIAFASTPNWIRPVLANVSPVVTLLLVFVLVSQAPIDSTFLSLGLHLLAYFLTALLCHCELARDRPAAEHLTGYYLWISLGGMVGGIFNALLAPLIFTLAWEYPIAIAIGCLLIPKLDDDSAPKAALKPGQKPKRPPMSEGSQRLLDGLVPLLMLMIMAILTMLNGREWFVEMCEVIADKATEFLKFCGLNILLGGKNVSLLLVYALPAMLCFFFIDRPVRFGLCVAAVLFVGYYRQESRSNQRQTIATERSFFGILKVEEYPDYHQRRLVHGTTLHGTQATATKLHPFDVLEMNVANTQWDALLTLGAYHAWDFRQEPLTYYHRTGPVGHIMAAMQQDHPNAPFAMVGLGTGSVSCYAHKDQKLTFYEIDPKVKELVADTDEFFTYVGDARRRGANVDIILGDARLKLEESDAKYQLLLVDAFSSDSIPVHLLTKEAVELYMNRITPDGRLALHISNKFVKLDLVVAKIAEELGLAARLWSDDNERGPGKTMSSWVILARNEADLGPLALPLNATGSLGGDWRELKTDPAVSAWTDDYSDVLSVMMIKEIQRLRYRLGLPTVEALRE